MPSSRVSGILPLLSSRAIASSLELANLNLFTRNGCHRNVYVTVAMQAPYTIHERKLLSRFSPYMKKSSSNLILNEW